MAKKSLLQKMKDLRKRGTLKGFKASKTDRNTAIDEGTRRNLQGAVYKKRKGKA